MMNEMNGWWGREEGKRKSEWGQGQVKGESILSNLIRLDSCLIVQIKMWLCVCVQLMWKWGWNRFSKSNNQFFISFSSLHHILFFNHFTLIWWLWFSINVNEWWYWKQIERVIIITKYINQLSSSSHCIEFSSANRYLERSDAISDDGASWPQFIGLILSISLSDGLLESWLIDEKWNDKMIKWMSNIKYFKFRQSTNR